MNALLSAIPSPPNPELGIGPLQFRYYGLAIAFGVLAAISIARRRWEARGGTRRHHDHRHLGGARRTDRREALPRHHRLEPALLGRPLVARRLMIWKGGLGIPGGVLAGVAVGALCAAA